MGLAVEWIRCPLILILYLFVDISTSLWCSIWVTSGIKGKFKSQQKPSIKSFRSKYLNCRTDCTWKHSILNIFGFREKIPCTAHWYLRPIACFPFITACVIFTFFLIFWPGGCITFSLRICTCYCPFLDPFATVC